LITALITAQRCAQAITAVVHDVPTGCPERRLYEPLREFITRDYFDAMMRGLVAAERITRRGNRYFPALRLSATAEGSRANRVEPNRKSD
jgi:hypothetical protein